VPCEEPCKEKLKCGHDCISFCGEPCPPQCRICNKKELTEFVLYGFEEDEDARFILLEDCKHAIEQNGMEYYMTHQIEEGEIEVKTCPRCKTIIRHNRRYGNILRTRLKDIMNVKKKVFGNSEELLNTSVKLYSELSSGWTTDFIKDTKKFILDQLVDVYYHTDGTKTKKWKKVDVHRMHSLNYIASLGRDVIKHLNDTALSTQPILHIDLAHRYKEMFYHLCKRELPLSYIEMRDFNKEFDRMYEYYLLYLRKASPRFTTGHSRAEPLYQRALGILKNRGVFSDQMKAQLREVLKNIDESIKSGLGISDTERREILAAFNMRQGRWFKCPNGHVYVITECGGAMQESTCNECGARIGGGSHRLRSDNALASEMDGATQPLYPQ